MSLDDILANVATSVLIEQMRPDRRVRIQPRAFVLPVLPPPPVKVPVDGNWPDSFCPSIDAALDRAWSAGTVKTYTSSINTFLKFCQSHRIPSEQTFPASDYLLCAFIAELSPSLSKNTISNYLCGLRAWHILNGYPFERSDRLNLIAKASRPLAKPLPPRPPVTLEMMEQLAAGLNLTDSRDVCIFACACTAFWGLARLGELLPGGYNFDRATPPFPSVQALSSGRSGSLKLMLPWTKVKKWDGETIILSVQEGVSNPVQAIQQHLRLNALAQDSLLFAYRDEHGLTFLLKRQFINCCTSIWKQTTSNSQSASGHSFRIGGTSHLLLCGVNPDIIKKSGRWSSDSFLRYWRNLDVVIPAHTTNASRRSGREGEPRAELGCGLLPSGVSSPAGASTSVARGRGPRG